MANKNMQRKFSKVMNMFIILIVMMVSPIIRDMQMKTTMILLKCLRLKRLAMRSIAEDVDLEQSHTHGGYK